MKKSLPDKVFFKIGEVSEITGIEQHVLRYWEEEFDVLKPSKNKSGQRLYQKKDIERVQEIKQLLYTERFTIAGARKKLKQTKKPTDQLNFGFDGEMFENWKKGALDELKAILKLAEK